jgi:hypothetical protein
MWLRNPTANDGHAWVQIKNLYLAASAIYATGTRTLMAHHNVVAERVSSARCIR